MSWLSELVIGDGVKGAGEGVKSALQGIGGFLQDIRQAITGDISPEKKAEIIQKAADAEAALSKAQTDINLAEAQSGSVFVAGWRPYIGWICGTAIACYYIPQSLMVTAVWCYSCVKLLQATSDITKFVLPPFPQPFGWAELFGLLLAMLGMGATRMVEKIQGVQGNH